MITVAYKCDRCGQLLERSIKTSVYRKDEYGQTVEQEVDLCQMCFETKKKHDNDFMEGNE